MSIVINILAFSWDAQQSEEFFPMFADDGMNYKLLHFALHIWSLSYWKVVDGIE